MNLDLRTSGMSLASPSLGLPGNHPGPFTRKSNLFFIPLITPIFLMM